MDPEILMKAKDFGDLKWQEFQLHSIKLKQQTDRAMHQILKDLERCHEEKRSRLLNYSDVKLQNTPESLIAAVSKEQNQMESYMDNFTSILLSCQSKHHLDTSEVNRLHELMMQRKNKLLHDLRLVQNGEMVDLQEVRLCTEEAKKILFRLVQKIDQAKMKAAEEEKRLKEEQEAKRIQKKREEEEAKRVQKKKEEEAERVKTEEEEKAKQKSENEARSSKQQDLSDQQPVAPSSIPVATSAETGRQDHDASLSRNRKATTDVNMEKYVEYQNFRTYVEDQCSCLINDSKWSKYRFKLQKAVMAPLNTMGIITGAQLHKKLNSLLRLLGGETVDVVGGRVSTKEHPAGTWFTENYLAKQLVGKSESLASQRDVLFGLASLAVAIWCQNKDIGFLILAHLYLKCPYAALIHLTQGDKTEEEFFKSLGYIIEDGNVEHESKFLDRMAGYISLYAAIIVSSPPSMDQSHPRGLSNAWKWLSTVANSEPLPGITATIVFTFLDICGCHMMRTYGQQFWKLVELLYRSFLPKIKSCGGDGGPISRLEEFLLQSLKTRNIKEPQGYLGPNVWNMR